MYVCIYICKMYECMYVHLYNYIGLYLQNYEYIYM